MKKKEFKSKWFGKDLPQFEQEYNADLNSVIQDELDKFNEHLYDKFGLVFFEAKDIQSYLNSNK